MNRQITRALVCAIAAVTVVTVSIALLSWRASINRRVRLATNLWTILRALDVYWVDHGEYPPTLNSLGQYDVTEETQPGVVYTYWSAERYSYDFPFDLPGEHKVLFYYPLEGDSAWICAGGTIAKGTIKLVRPTTQPPRGAGKP